MYFEGENGVFFHLIGPEDVDQTWVLNGEELVPFNLVCERGNISLTEVGLLIWQAFLLNT